MGDSSQYLYYFYNTIKDKFRQEKYLQLTQKRSQGRAANLTKLRMLSHKLSIETGRCQSKHVETWNCHLCTTSDENTAEAFFQLPFLEQFTEGGQHLLTECPYYEDIRRSLPESIRSNGDNFKSYGRLISTACCPECEQPVQKRYMYKGITIMNDEILLRYKTIFIILH